MEDSSQKSTLFEQLDVESLGVTFENSLTYSEEFNVYLYRSFYNGAGTGLADFNNDGFLDLFFCGNQVDNILYLGDGKFNFKDVTKIAGVSSPNAWSTGVSIVDINQDGLLDIYICKSGDPKGTNRRNELFINMGNNEDGVPVFKESAAQYGIDDLGFSIHALFFDYDKDGDLDMYLSNNSINPTDLIMDAKRGMREREDPGGGDKLYRNDGGIFTNVSKEAGIYSSAIGFGLGISVADVNRDGWPDIYVANDYFEMDYLYINNHDGTFTESMKQYISELSLGSMGVDIADMNHDGYPEIFVTEMLPDDEARLKTKADFDNWNKYELKLNNGYHRQFSRNSFQLNNKRIPGTENVNFSEVSRYAGVAATDWSWGVQMVDFNLDGNNEIFVTNGIAKDLLDQDYINFYYDPAKIRKTLREKGAVIKELIDNIPSQPISNYLFKEIGDMKFKNLATEWGLDRPGFSNGAAYGDIDNDGDYDLVVNNINQPPFIYRNNVDHKENHFVALSIKNKNNATAIGAQVTLYVNGILHYKELYPMRGVMSVVDDRLLFGIGKETKIDSLNIVWPDGARIIDRHIPIDQFLVYNYPDKNSKGGVNILEKEEKVLLKDITDSLSLHHRHVESDFVDFDRSKLLFHMFSNEGPKIAVGDVNGDGLDDFYIGGAKNESGSLYIQGKNGFSATNDGLFEYDKLSEDTNALFFDADGDKDLDLLVSSGSPEFSDSSYALLDRLYINDGTGKFEKSEQLLPTSKPLSTSVVVNADFDRDGDQDLFFGGRFKSGAYGLPTSSYLLENDGHGKFTDVTKQRAKGLIDLGMVTDAVWSDFDGDGDLDLIVTGQWMPIRVFENSHGNFKEVTKEVGLQITKGFWNVLVKADLDGDGDDDLIAGNLGDNTFFKASVERPVRMYLNDFDKNGTIEQIITTYRGDKSYPLTLKTEITTQMPFLLKKYLKFSDYKEQTIDQIFTKEELENSLVLEVFTNKTTIFWNEGGRFVAQELPKEAQLTPIYAIHCEDIDNDGNLEIILGGNQYRAKPQTGIYAGGHGLVLKACGDKEYKSLSMENSGLNLDGQVRDIMEIKINGKKNLIIAKNDDVIKVYEICEEKK